MTDRVVNLAGQVVDRMDRGRSLGQALERARVPLRPGEFVVVLTGASLGVAALLLALAHSRTLALFGGAVTAMLGVQIVKRRVSKRRRAFEAQLPDALGLIASSLSAGHTFLRAIQMMCEEAGPPMSEEFSRVVAETRLGDSVVDALERMAGRLQIRDMDMVVQAIRIQQTVGGRLADLLHTLSDFIRARDEVRREVKVLTAEGRMSAYVLTGLVPFLFGVIKVMNPTYISPLFRGWGVAILVYCGASVVLGLVVILRMVKIEI
jgi:tight adherence protein B